MAALRSLLLLTPLWTACAPDEGEVLPRALAGPPQLCVGPAVAWHLQAGTPFISVQEAILHLTPGDTVVVCPGTHDGPWMIPYNSEVRIRGFTGDPADVVLTGNDVDHTLYTEAPGVLFLSVEAITFVHGNNGNIGLSGGSMVFGGSGPNGAGTLLLRDVVFRDNYDTYDNGTLHADASRFSCVRCLFEDNNAQGNPGIIIDIQDAGTVTIRDSIFRFNTTWGFDDGGGLAIRDGHRPVPGRIGTVTIEDTTFEDNVILGSGAGLSAYFLLPARLGLRNVSFRRNQSTDPGAEGGAMSIVTADPLGQVRLVNVVMEDNEATKYAAFVHYNDMHDAPMSSTFGMWGGAIRRNIASSTDPGEGSAAFLYPTVVGWFHDVDFGTGADDNLPFDFADCPTAYGPHTTGRVEFFAGDHCP